MGREKRTVMLVGCWMRKSPTFREVNTPPFEKMPLYTAVTQTTGWLKTLTRQWHVLNLNNEGETHG